MLLKAIDADPALLRQFVARAEASLLEVNDLLRSTSNAQGEAALLKRLDEAARRVHAIKGDAGTLGLDTIAGQAHQFETELARVREAGGGDVGAALLALPLPLEELLTRIGALKTLVGLRRPGAEPAAPESANAGLAQLAATVAADAGKKVAASVRMGAVADLEDGQAALLREIAVQLVRNAVTHGIETPVLRRAAHKDETGRIEVQLTRAEAEWTLSVRDDGGGLSAARVRQRLLALGWYTQEQLDSFDDRQIVSHIFRPGFSTAASVSMHAGRGVGLDLVQANVQKLGARLLLASTPGQHTEFKIKFAA
jgi:chemotaxis protein histidine kinase CheA